MKKMYLENGKPVKLINTLPKKSGAKDYLVIVDELFKKPPIEDKKEEINILNEQLIKLKQESIELCETIKSIKDNINRYSATKNLFELLSDEITHFIIIDEYNCPLILTKHEVTLERMNLSTLSLFIRKNKDQNLIECKIDSSVNNNAKWSNIIPCHSYSEGVEIIKEKINELEDNIDESSIEFTHNELFFIKMASNYNLEINKNIIKKLRSKLEYIYKIQKQYQLQSIEEYYTETKSLFDKLDKI